MSEWSVITVVRMSRFVILLIVLSWTPYVGAIKPEAPCPNQLDGLNRSINPDLDLDIEQNLVRYKGVSFRVTPLECTLLRLILDAPKESISYDDLIYGIWNDKEPEYSLETVRQTMLKLRKKFIRIDPHFNSLKTRIKVGYFWERDHHDKISTGRVAVAKHINLGYADGQHIHLNQNEHAILTSIIKRELVAASTVQISSVRTFKTVACRLNRKFKEVLGTNLLVGGPFGMQAFRLNKALRKQ